MKLHPLDGRINKGFTTWGCMWKQGECSADTEYICRDSVGKEVPMQSRITAWWPDGSVKWTAHTADSELCGEEIEVLPAETIEGKACTCVEKQNPAQDGNGQIKVSGYEDGQGIAITETEEMLTLDCGLLKVEIEKKGRYLFRKVTRNGKDCGYEARPRLILEEPVVVNGRKGCVEKEYWGRVDSVVLEEQGPMECVVKYEGTHVDESNGEERLPFIIRMRVNYDGPELRFTHTFFYDGDENKDWLKGLGICFNVPGAGGDYNRHVKVTGDHGVLHEMSVNTISWHPRIPQELHERQVAGECLQLDETEKEILDEVMAACPHFDIYDIYQDSVSHYAVKKKLAGEEFCFLDCEDGYRTQGGVAVGTEAGSVMLCIRDFWEKYPSGYTVSGLTKDKLSVDIWLWSPGAKAFDFRHYAPRGYNQVCYEGYDYKGADPVGIACTNECAVAFREEMIPEDQELLDFTESVNHPAQYVGTPEFYHEMKAFGYWSLPGGETEMEKWLEEQLETCFAFYKNEVEQRGWYGMFNYGDFMHTYDPARHKWRYDVGGFAWDNTELVPTLWLWLYFMRTGRGDVFTLAEKLCRHASEVDVYHMGKYKGLGSRHNVRHWGCPCKEARIAMAGHHRYLYYMTGDYRFGDIFEELKDNEFSFLNKDPMGDFYEKKDMVFPSHARSGPDWSSLCSNWMTRWERFNDTVYRDKILVGIEDIKKAPLKLVSGCDFEFDPASCHLRYIGERTAGGSHLQICMGAPEIWTELADLLEDKEWKDMVAGLGRFYFLPREEQFAESGGIIGSREFTFPFMASGVGAYGASYLKDEKLAERVWKALLATILSENDERGFDTIITKNQGNRENLVEIPWLSTNFAAQFCLNVIMCLEFIRKALPKTMEEAKALIEGSTGFHKA